MLLSDLASIWVERWLAHGGTLFANPEAGTVQISMRLDWRRKTPAGAPSWQREGSRAYDMWNTGRWRELSELCGLIPGLKQAIIAHIEQHGQPWSDGLYMAHKEAA